MQSHLPSSIHLMKKYLTLGLFTLFFGAFASSALALATPPKNSLNLSAKDIESISDKIWQNESDKSIPGLTHWNFGESFPSLGIGHFIWYTTEKREDFDESFPKLIQYMREQHIAVPKWLDNPNTPACPWQTREEFLRAIKGKEPRMEELRGFLLKTKKAQAQYLIYRLKTVLPKILDLVPSKERTSIQNNITKLMQTPIGVYSLVDYINFKGDGIKEYKRCALKKFPIDIKQISKDLTPEQAYACGWGVLQVSRKMLQAPTNLTPNEAFSWAASETLKIRVASAPKNRKSFEEKWLPGWLKRTGTYTYKGKNFG
jgi:hypothetical protein